MSGLETAIRNALERSDRSDPENRARIYQSARQALEAGLRKQSVTDPQVIFAQRQRLEDKIQEIEIQERVRLREAAREPEPDVPDILVDSPAEPVAADRHLEPEMTLGGQSRASSPEAAAPVADILHVAPVAPVSRANAEPVPNDGDGFSEMRAEREAERPAAPIAPSKKNKRAKADTEPAAEYAPQVPGEKRKRRKRRGTIGYILSLMVLAGVGYGGWWAYSNGLLLLPAGKSANAPVNRAGLARDPGTGREPGAAFDPQRGFSSDWLEVFSAGGKAAASPGKDASADPMPRADGTALRITSRSPGASGDVGIDVPVDILRQLSGKTSTIALTLQSASDNSVQLSVRCDFSSLGSCSRHRVTATQERSDTLFRVAFDRTLAPNQPGRIYINSDILGGSQPVFLYSIRVLPGQ
ncbi:hypothetical protein [Rhizobium oryzicola]|uniref:Biotin transporter BioY n=1 Tax=Rhizobium oryzicola TaxID=1232668 RepID=A0ABT8SRC2_9HYPH|nr:hypothetical protein [Rhizobium oryzicola]MDO1580891.1 hypothetical protein [Rhizobium oryzicola]